MNPFRSSRFVYIYRVRFHVWDSYTQQQVQNKHMQNRSATGLFYLSLSPSISSEYTIKRESLHTHSSMNTISSNSNTCVYCFLSLSGVSVTYHTCNVKICRPKLSELVWSWKNELKNNSTPTPTTIRFCRSNSTPTPTAIKIFQSNSTPTPSEKLGNSGVNSDPELELPISALNVIRVLLLLPSKTKPLPLCLPEPVTD